MIGTGKTRHTNSCLSNSSRGKEEPWSTKTAKEKKREKENNYALQGIKGRKTIN